MSITLNLQPEVERGLLAQATARGVSLDEFVREIVTREAHVPEEPEQRTGQAFVDASAKLRGLFTNEEVDTMFSRNRSSSRPVDFE